MTTALGNRLRKLEAATGIGGGHCICPDRKFNIVVRWPDQESTSSSGPELCDKCGRLRYVAIMNVVYDAPLPPKNPPASSTA
jgi:hypothetical protein